MAKTATKNSGKKRGPPQKECPSCHKLVHARKTICPECGAMIPKKEGTPKTVKTRQPQTRPTATNGQANIRVILTVHSLLRSMDAATLKKIVDDVADAKVPF